MAQAKAPEVEQREKEAVDLIPEERVKEIVDILLPCGYSHYDGNKYTGVSPYIGSSTNIITIIVNEPEGWDGVFVILMECFTGDVDDNDCLGYYLGIMKVIAPELVSHDSFFNKSDMNVLHFTWASGGEQHIRFPVKVIMEK